VRRFLSNYFDLLLLHRKCCDDDDDDLDDDDALKYNKLSYHMMSQASEATTRVVYHANLSKHLQYSFSICFFKLLRNEQDITVV